MLFVEKDEKQQWLSVSLTDVCGGPKHTPTTRNKRLKGDLQLIQSNQVREAFEEKPQ